jgi:hypothetical protein
MDRALSNRCTLPPTRIIHWINIKNDIIICLNLFSNSPPNPPLLLNKNWLQQVLLASSTHFFN